MRPGAPPGPTSSRRSPGVWASSRSSHRSRCGVTDVRSESLAAADAGMQYGEVLIVDGLTSLELGEAGAAASAVYDHSIGLRLLYSDPDSGEEHYLIRYPAGLSGRMHR